MNPVSDNPATGMSFQALEKVARPKYYNNLLLIPDLILELICFACVDIFFPSGHFLKS